VNVTVAIMLIVGTIGGFVTPASASPSWSFVSSPNPAGGELSSLNSVVCLTATDCVAVGDSYFSTHIKAYEHTLVERWNGHRWSISPSPHPGTYSVLNAVSCSAPGFCVAVGSQDAFALVEEWNGSQWSVVPTPHKISAIPYSLLGASCRTSKDCVAVGYFYRPGGRNTLVEHWDGRRWSIVPSPTPTETLDRPPDSELSGVSCTTGTACVAVGRDRQVPLVEQWNGTKWSIVPSPHPRVRGAESALKSVKCTSNTICVAVGFNGGTNFFPPSGDALHAAQLSLPKRCLPTYLHCAVADSLIERWNGTTWSILSSPNVPGYDNGLAAVKCVSAVDCTAVGGAFNTLVLSRQPGYRLIEHYNGRTWSIVANPGPAATTASALGGISCATRTDCIAVGSYVPNLRASPPYEKTFVERYSP